MDFWVITVVPPPVRLVVFQGGRRESVAQVLVTRNLDDGNTEYGHVKCIKVRSDFRGQGFGYLLLKEASHAEHTGYKTRSTILLQLNRYVSIYRKPVTGF